MLSFVTDTSSSLWDIQLKYLECFRYSSLIAKMFNPVKIFEPINISGTFTIVNTTEHRHEDESIKVYDVTLTIVINDIHMYMSNHQVSRIFVIT